MRAEADLGMFSRTMAPQKGVPTCQPCNIFWKPLIACCNIKNVHSLWSRDCTPHCEIWNLLRYLYIFPEQKIFTDCPNFLL